MMKLLKKRGVSPLIATVLLMVVSIILAVVFYGMVNNWWGGASQIFAIETTGTQVYMEQSSGTGRIILVLKNAGTATFQIERIKIVGTKNDGGYTTISFSATGPSFNYSGTSIEGELWGSSSSVDIVNNILIITPGQMASIEVWFDGSANKMTDVFDVGRSYHVTAYPLGGTGRPYDFVITISPA